MKNEEFSAKFFSWIGTYPEYFLSEILNPETSYSLGTRSKTQMLALMTFYLNIMGHLILKCLFLFPPPPPQTPQFFLLVLTCYTKVLRS